MTLYQKEVRRLGAALYPREDLTRRIIAAKRFIDRRYADDIDLEAMSSQACVSKYHFIRLFKRYYGRTPYRYLTEVRIARAKELIRCGASVQKACFSVGYDSVTSFSARFKKIAGSPPSAIPQKRNSG